LCLTCGQAFARRLFERLARAVDERVLPLALALAATAGGGNAWGAAVCAAHPQPSLVRTLLFRAGTAAERAELLPQAAAAVAKACAQPAAFASCRKELALEDVNFL
jgi:hypothetical protein